MPDDLSYLDKQVQQRLKGGQMYVHCPHCDAELYTNIPYCNYCGKNTGYDINGNFSNSYSNKGLVGPQANTDLDKKIRSDGGGSQNYYDLPPGAEQLQDLIDYRNMNGNIKDIFKSCYRSGLKQGTSEEYDARKRVYYSLRELGRLLGRKDYITLAKEVIEHQAKEPNKDK